LKTKTGILFILALILSMTLFNGKSFAQLKLGYVDSEVIIKQLPEYKKITDELESLQKTYLDTIGMKDKEIKDKAATFKSKYEDAQKKIESGEIKSDAEIKALNEEMNILQKELQTLDDGLTTYKQTVRDALVARQSELFKPVKDRIIKAIEDLSKEQKYNFVFDKAEGIGVVLYGDKDLDLTFKVLDKLK
jgi:outer membrane protein